ncbi:MAG: TetR/AcrR family transcriptional regulator [Acidimicrobiales bacterium]
MSTQEPAGGFRLGTPSRNDQHVTSFGALGSREAIIRAGERLLAERGITAVSLREIAAAAGQGNTSAVRYHFGSRDGLVDAILTYRMTRIDERRRAMLAGRPPSTRGAGSAGLRFLLEALIFPLAESIGHEDGESWYARFLHQAVFLPGFDGFAPSRHAVTRGLRAVVDGLTDHLDGLPSTLAEQRVMRVVQMVLHALADHEALMARGGAPVTTALLSGDLVDTAVAVLSAAPSAATLGELAHLQTKGA